MGPRPAVTLWKKLVDWCTPVAVNCTAKLSTSTHCKTEYLDTANMTMGNLLHRTQHTQHTQRATVYVGIAWFSLAPLALFVAVVFGRCCWLLFVLVPGRHRANALQRTVCTVNQTVTWSQSGILTLSCDNPNACCLAEHVCAHVRMAACPHPQTHCHLWQPGPNKQSAHAQLQHSLEL